MIGIMNHLVLPFVLCLFHFYIYFFLPEMQGREVPIDNMHDTPRKLKSDITA